MKRKPQNKPSPFAVVINDDPAQLKVLSGLLLKAGLNSRVFTGVEAALTDMTAKDGALPALIVTDLYMPGIDGWRFCRLLRSTEYDALNNIPILVVSATFVGEEPDRIAADLGADAFLSSPVDGKRFGEQVRAILNKKQVQNPLRVLIVEDSRTISGMLKKAFAANGYEADTALTFRAAADAFAKTAYDVAVLDYHLPDGSGDALLDAFRAARPDCVCIMMTIDPGPGLALDWMKRGAAAYLRKPFKPEYLIELCANAHRERSLLRVQDLLELRTRELRESEERYRGVYAGTPDGIIIHDAEGRILDANEAMAQRLEIPRKELPGHRIAEFITPDNAANIGDNARITIAGQSHVFETTYVSATGRAIPAEVHERRIQWRNVQAVLSISRNITERKQAQEALRESEANYKQLFDNSPAAIYQINFRTGKFLKANDLICEYLGCSQEEITSLAPYDFITKESQELFLERLSKMAIGDKAPEDPEYEFVDKKGKHRWLKLNSKNIYDSEGLAGAHVVAHDITQRKRAEDKLQESEDKYRTILENIEDGYYEVAINGNFTFFNESMCRILGYSQEEMMGINNRQYTDKENAKKLFKTFNKVYRTGEPAKTFDWQIISKDGIKKYIEASVSLRKDSLGNPIGFGGIVRDITERKQTEVEKAKLETQLQQAQKMESVGRLAGGVAHDFNNMLSVILGYTEMAINQAGAGHPLNRHLTQIHNAAERSASLTQQLLAFARKQTVAPRVLDLNETIESMLKMLQRLIGEDIELKWHPKADLWPVKLDPSQIDQILANLCVNARDAIADVGKIVIETENSTFDKSYCENHPGFAPGKYLRLAVSDDGCGMDKETLDKLFEPFFTTKDTGKGTGLGLATVYGIVKQNNGFINVYSEPGQGTTFTIYLPSHKGKAGQTRPEAPATPAARGHETILLVEDEPAILEMATTMLERQGYTVRAAGTPGEAIRLAREHTGEIDLLVTDVVMPEMNGRDLAKNLLSLYPHLKRLFMSGYTANVIAHHGVLDEGVYFIQKPFSISELTAKVREALDGNENPL